MRPLCDSLGLEVIGLQPGQFDAAGPALNAAFSSPASGGLLLIRGGDNDSSMDPKELLALSSHFGELEDNPVEKAKPAGEPRHLLPGYDEILLLGTDDTGTYRPVFELFPPPRTSTMQAIQVRV